MWRNTKRDTRSCERHSPLCKIRNIVAFLQKKLNVSLQTRCFGFRGCTKRLLEPVKGNTPSGESVVQKRWREKKEAESEEIFPDEPYASDLSDAERMILQPLIPPAKPGGRSRSVNMRQLLNGIFSILRSGGSLAGCSLMTIPPSRRCMTTFVHGATLVYGKRW